MDGSFEEVVSDFLLLFVSPSKAFLVACVEAHVRVAVRHCLSCGEFGEVFILASQCLHFPADIWGYLSPEMFFLQGVFLKFSASFALLLVFFLFLVEEVFNVLFRFHYVCLGV